MTKQTVAHLSSKYNVPAATIRQLADWSRKYQAATTQQMRERVMRAYDAIVASKCGGFDPLV